MNEFTITDSDIIYEEYRMTYRALKQKQQQAHRHDSLRVGWHGVNYIRV